MQVWVHAKRAAVVGVAMVVVALGPGAQAQPLPLEEFSPAFLGMYRKVMEIEPEIRRHARRYGVDADLALAVCLYESGGNAGLASAAGAQGYFQVMPATFRELSVESNIEAGVKYLAQMLHKFGREDRAVAAYNGGPGRVGRAGGLPLETLQYVLGVGQYRTVLKQFDESLRWHATRMRLADVKAGDNWSTLSARFGVPAWQLRWHNPFLTGRSLRVGESVAYPAEPRSDLLIPINGGGAYRMRHGDHYIKLAITLGLEPEALRAENGLWQTQVVPAGMLLRIPLSIDRADVIKTALGERAGAATLPPSAVQPRTRQPVMVAHIVEHGDTLSGLAQRYGTTVRAIQKANGLSRTAIAIGQSLRIPRPRSAAAG